MKLESINFPRSLPMDTMHHLFLNVAPQIWSLSSIELLSDDDIAGINIVMASIKFPSWIERDLRNLKDAESWKAARTSFSLFSFSFLSLFSFSLSLSLSFFLQNALSA